MTTDDKDKAAEQAAADQKKDADERSKANEGKFDAEAETARVRENIINAPEPGTDPDSKQRLAKSLVASGVDLPAGLSVDPVTPEDREAHVAKFNTADDTDAGDENDDKRQTAAQRRAAAGTGRNTAPQNRTATPLNKEKASE